MGIRSCLAGIILVFSVSEESRSLAGESHFLNSSIYILKLAPKSLTIGLHIYSFSSCSGSRVHAESIEPIPNIVRRSGEYENDVLATHNNNTFSGNYIRSQVPDVSKPSRPIVLIMRIFTTRWCVKIVSNGYLANWLNSAWHLASCCR